MMALGATFLEDKIRIRELFFSSTKGGSLLYPKDGPGFETPMAKFVSTSFVDNGSRGVDHLNALRTWRSPISVAVICRSLFCSQRASTAMPFGRGLQFAKTPKRNGSNREAKGFNRWEV
ncbi:hypothetical protein KCU83_g588, partial [Aureobasidium melanogenum]